MIADALHDVTDVLCIEEANGQSHQFGNKVGDQRNADASVHVQANPALDKSNSHLGDREYQLRYQYQCDKV